MKKSKFFVIDKHGRRRRAINVKCYCCGKTRLKDIRKAKKLKTNVCLDCYRTRINPFKIRKYLPEMERNEKGQFTKRKDK